MQMQVHFQSVMSSIIRQTDRQTSGNFHPLPLINLWQKPFAKKAVVMPKTKFVVSDILQIY